MNTDEVDNCGTLILAGGDLGFNWLPIHLALRKGLFKKNGISVELVNMGGADEAAMAVRNGEAHLAIARPEDAITSYVNGGNLRIVAGNVNRLPLSLVAQPGIESIEGLKGKVVGISSMPEDTAGYARAMLEMHGLRYPDDYEIALVGLPPEGRRALKAGRIDAVVQLLPFNFVALDEGYSHLGEVSDYISEVVFTALIGDKNWLDANSYAVKAVTSSLMEATELLYDGESEALLYQLVMELTCADADYANVSLDYIRYKKVFARSLEIPLAAIKKSIELMTVANLIEPKYREMALGVVDTSYLQSAVVAG